MSRLIQFLLTLAAEEFYGEIRITLHKGAVHGQIAVSRTYLEETLPLPHAGDLRYQKALRDAAMRVSLPA